MTIYILDVRLVKQVQECQGDEREHLFFLYDVHRRPSQPEDREDFEVHGTAKVAGN